MNVPIKVIRIFNTYGPRMHPNRRPGGLELHRARHSLATTSPSTAMAQQTRSFCFVDDLIEGMISHDGDAG